MNPYLNLDEIKEAFRKIYLEENYDFLEELSDPDSKYDLEKAKVIANVAQTIINSASVENQYLKKYL